MRFMLMHKADKTSEAGGPVPPEVLAGMGKLLEDMRKDGALLAGEGLRPHSNTVRLKFSGGRRSLTRGPFTDSNGLIAGFAILRTTSMDDAIEWATRFANVVGDVEIDIGLVVEPWDLGMFPKPEGLTTTRFMLMHKADKTSESGAPASPQVMAGIRRLNEDMVKAGVFVTAEGMQPSSKAVRLNYSGGKCVTLDGPFTESKELIAGFCMLRANSREEALKWVPRFVAVVAGLGDIEIDVRPLHEPSNLA